MNELEEDPEFKGRRLMPIDLSVDSNPWDNIVKLSIRHVVVDIESKSVHQVLKEVNGKIAPAPIEIHFLSCPVSTISLI